MSNKKKSLFHTNRRRNLEALKSRKVLRRNKYKGGYTNQKPYIYENDSSNIHLYGQELLLSKEVKQSLILKTVVTTLLVNISVIFLVFKSLTSATKTLLYLLLVDDGALVDLKIEGLTREHIGSSADKPVVVNIDMGTTDPEKPEAFVNGYSKIAKGIFYTSLVVGAGLFLLWATGDNGEFALLKNLEFTKILSEGLFKTQDVSLNLNADQIKQLAVELGKQNAFSTELSGQLDECCQKILNAITNLFMHNTSDKGSGSSSGQDPYVTLPSEWFS